MDSKITYRQAQAWILSDIDKDDKYKNVSVYNSDGKYPGATGFLELCRRSRTALSNPVFS